MEQNKQQEFISGIYSNDVANTAPEWILGKGSIHVKKLQTWLDTHKNLADENGYIRYTIKRAKDGVKRYVEVDFYKPTPKVEKETTYEDLMARQEVALDGTT